MTGVGTIDVGTWSGNSPMARTPTAIWEFRVWFPTKGPDIIGGW